MSHSGEAPATSASVRAGAGAKARAFAPGATRQLRPGAFRQGLAPGTSR